MDLMYEDEPTTIWFPEDFDKLLVWACENNASDINLVPKDPVWIRVFGSWQVATRRPLSNDEIAHLLDAYAGTSSASARVAGRETLDFLHEIRKDRFTRDRFRVNATGCKDGVSIGVNIIFRSIPSLPPKIEDMKMEEGILKGCFPDNGLVLVCGVMGSGKSTLLASIFRHIIETKNRHVGTYEAPIEFDLMGVPDKSGPIIQMEIPTHIQDFGEAIRATTRKAQDVVLVGESRDLETLRGMVTVAEVGVAAYSTIHTRSVAETPARIINMFPESLQNQIGISLLSSLRMIIYQRLVKTVDGGRTALREYLEFDDDTREFLINNRGSLFQELKRLVPAQGQTIMMDAKIKFDDGVIDQKTFDLLEKEFE